MTGGSRTQVYTRARVCTHPHPFSTPRGGNPALAPGAGRFPLGSGCPLHTLWLALPPPWGSSPPSLAPVPKPSGSFQKLSTSLKDGRFTLLKTGVSMLVLSSTLNSGSFVRVTGRGGLACGASLTEALSPNPALPSASTPGQWQSWDEPCGGQQVDNLPGDS